MAQDEPHGTTSAQDNESSSTPPPGFLQRMGWYAVTYLQKLIIPILSHYGILLRRISAESPPTLSKTYPCLPGYPNRIWIPISPRSSGKLPVLITFHSGGFSIMDPSYTDEFCYHMANTYDIIVIAANYHKAPAFQFPTQPNDAANVIRAIIDDSSDELRIADMSNVAVCGFSSGANLCMAVGQLPILKKQDGSLLIKGALGIYGNYDLTTNATEKMARTERSESEFEDSLKGNIHNISWVYAPNPEDRAGPLASPYFATRSVLPRSVYLIASELDILWPESKIMAERLAREEKAAAGEQGLTFPKRIDTDAGWKEGGVRWESLKGVGHGFDIMQAKSEEEELRRAKTFEEMCARIAMWLKEEVFV